MHTETLCLQKVHMDRSSRHHQSRRQSQMFFFHQIEFQTQILHLNKYIFLELGKQERKDKNFALSIKYKHRILFLSQLLTVQIKRLKMKIQLALAFVLAFSSKVSMTIQNYFTFTHCIF